MALAHINVNILNHLLNQQPWSRDQLCRFAGKTLWLSVPPITLHLLIESHGEFAALTSEKNFSPDATIGLPPSAALKLLLQQPLDASQLTLEGDTELAAEVGKVMRSLSWDVEEDLSHVVGDISAHKLVSVSKQAAQEAKRQITSLGGIFAEFWQEEAPMIAKRRHLQQFTQQVDTLRDDVERLTKRIEKLEPSA